MKREPGPQVRIVSPASAAANNGNWHTAARWRRFLAPVATVEIAGVDEDEDGVGPGDARRPGGVDKAVGGVDVRAAQDPELREPGQVAQFPGDRVDAGAPGHAPGPFVEVEGARQGRRAALAQRFGERRAGEPPGVSGHRAAARVT